MRTPRYLAYLAVKPSVGQRVVIAGDFRLLRIVHVGATFVELGLSRSRQAAGFLSLDRLEWDRVAGLWRSAFPAAAPEAPR